MAIGTNIRKIRELKGLTQKQLGNLCNPPIAESTIRRYELGKLNPKYETIEKIAKALKISPLELAENYPTDILKSLDSDYAMGMILTMLFEIIYDSAEKKIVRVKGKGIGSYHILKDADQTFAISEERFHSLCDQILDLISKSVPRIAEDEAEIIKDITRILKEK